jgi:SAM-dependent methyltransferase
VLPELVERFCVGRGLEIGPGNHPVCDRANTIFLDRFSNNPDACPHPDIVSDAARIPVRNGTFDFLLSSHMLEHHQDTLRTLYEWKRVLRPGGVLFLVLPHYQRTFDKYRKITSLQHHIDDYARLGDSLDTSHYEEIFEGWSKIENFDQERAKFEAQWHIDAWDWAGRVRNGVIHYHVWTQNELVDIFRYVGLSVEYVADILPERYDSFLIVGRV